MLLNADFLRLKMRSQKVVLTNGGSLDIFSERFAKWAGTNGAILSALVNSNKDGALEIFKEIIKTDG